jgi:hypothetical protein
MLLNINLQIHRVQVQLLATCWRCTGHNIYFCYGEPNNLPLAIITFVSRELAHQVRLIVGNSFLKRFCTQIIFHSLWALDGVVKPLPNNCNGRLWPGFQAFIKYQL